MEARGRLYFLEVPEEYHMVRFIIPGEDMVPSTRFERFCPPMTRLAPPWMTVRDFFNDSVFAVFPENLNEE